MNAYELGSPERELVMWYKIKELSEKSRCRISATAFIAKTVDKSACIAPLSDRSTQVKTTLQKGGVPATPSGTATLLRLSPSHRFCPRPFLAVADFRHPQLPWLDGRCVQGPGTYSPRHG